jgi:hypothetical protein
MINLPVEIAGVLVLLSPARTAEYQRGYVEKAAIL